MHGYEDKPSIYWSHSGQQASPPFPSLCVGPRTFVAVGEEKYPAPLAVEGREVVHNHPRILGDAATKHTHPFPVSSLQLGGA